MQLRDALEGGWTVSHRSVVSLIVEVSHFKVEARKVNLESVLCKGAALHHYIDGYLP